MKKYVVTGGGGFVGKALCRRLKGEGHEVISISRSDYPELRKLGVILVQLDLSLVGENLKEVFEGVDAVFHTAAKVDMWGDYESFYRNNVLATRNIIAACQAKEVSKLIYTSSPSVIADGSDLEGVNEQYPYPKKHKAYYPETKAIAEREVLQANSPGKLSTLSLRPHLIWGPGDTNLIPTILKRARAGKLIRVGKGLNIVDVCFIEDCVSAHMSAMKALDENPSAAGKAYFISQGEPVNMWSWINEILQKNNLPPVQKSIPAGVATCIAQVLETIARVLPGNKEPLLTKFLVSEMATSHYFDISSAKKELAWHPTHTIPQAMQKTFPNQDTHNPSPNPQH